MENGKNIIKGKKLVYPVLCVILFAVVLFSMFGEKVAYNDGAGWDGLFYRNVAYNFSEMIFNHGYDLYHIQRILPFGIINIIFNFFHFEKNNLSLLWGIQILNLITLLIGVYFFMLITRKLNFSISAIIISFSALFFNYPVLKLTGYYPFLTDIYALVFAIIQFYCFLDKRNIFLVIISIIGAFTWPTLFFSGLILVFLPREEFELSSVKTRSDKLLLNAMKILLLSGIPIVFIFAAVFFKITGKGNILEYEWGGILLNIYFVIPAFFAVSFYIWTLLRPLNISIIYSVKKFISSIKYVNIILFIIIYLLISIIQRYLSSSEASASLAYMLFVRLLMPSIQAPFGFIVNHFMYYGYLIIFLCLFWKEAVNQYAKSGYSFFIIIILGLMMTVNTESRHLLSFIPFLFFPVVEVIKKYITVKFAIIFSIMSLLLSRFWFKINVEGIEDAFVFVTHNDYAKFPAQRYFMSQGPWMSYPMYLLFLGFFVVSFIAIYLWIKRAKKLVPIGPQ